jgi:hypothetical protein
MGAGFDLTVFVAVAKTYSFFTGLIEIFYSLATIHGDYSSKSLSSFETF